MKLYVVLFESLNQTWVIFCITSDKEKAFETAKNINGIVCLLLSAETEN
jgi:hypothetical protein